MDRCTFLYSATQNYSVDWRFQTLQDGHLSTVVTLEEESQPFPNVTETVYSPVMTEHGFSVMLKQAETDECLDMGLPPGYNLHSYLWKEGRGAYQYEHRVYDRNGSSRWSCMELQEALEGIQPVVYATIFTDLNVGGRFQKESTHLQHRRHKEIMMKQLTQQSNVRKRSPIRIARAGLTRTLESLSVTGQLDVSQDNTQSSQNMTFTCSQRTNADAALPNLNRSAPITASSLFEGVCIRSGNDPPEEAFSGSMRRFSADLSNLSLGRSSEEGR
jgi:hypothetical protein